MIKEWLIICVSWCQSLLSETRNKQLSLQTRAKAYHFFFTFLRYNLTFGFFLSYGPICNIGNVDDSEIYKQMDSVLPHPTPSHSELYPVVKQPA